MTLSELCKQVIELDSNEPLIQQRRLLNPIDIYDAAKKLALAAQRMEGALKNFCEWEVHFGASWKVFNPRTETYEVFSGVPAKEALADVQKIVEGE